MKVSTHELKQLKKVINSSDFVNIMNNKQITIPMIQHQMIMRGVQFNPNATRKELNAILFGINPANFEEVDDNTIKQRLVAYNK